VVEGSAVGRRYDEDAGEHFVAESGAVAYLALIVGMRTVKGDETVKPEEPVLTAV
jgi:hypothetical protein